MGKLRLSVHRKNEVRKKYGCFYRVRIPRNIISIMTVSIPLQLLPLTVSLPLSTFSSSPVSSLPILRKRTIETKLLPQGTVYMYVCSVIMKHPTIAIMHACRLDWHIGCVQQAWIPSSCVLQSRKQLRANFLHCQDCRWLLMVCEAPWTLHSTSPMRTFEYFATVCGVRWTRGTGDANTGTKLHLPRKSWWEVLCPCIFQKRKVHGP